jgi:hypothetical protein
MGGLTVSIQGVVRAQTVHESYELLLRANERPVYKLFKPLNEAVLKSDHSASIYSVLEDHQKTTQMTLERIVAVSALETKAHAVLSIFWISCLLLFIGLAFYADPILKENWRQWKVRRERG